jgi:hypothetical protein
MGHGRYCGIPLTRVCLSMYALWHAGLYLAFHHQIEDSEGLSSCYVGQ